jgi:hypothetical protein
VLWRLKWFVWFPCNHALCGIVALWETFYLRPQITHSLLVAELSGAPRSLNPKAQLIESTADRVFLPLPL